MASDKKKICPNCFMMEYADGECQRCGYQEKFAPRSPRALPEGLVLNNRFIVGKVLGEGGFGITYKACDTEDGGICAIKEYIPSGISCRTENGRTLKVTSSDWEGQYQAGLKRFLEEAQILSKLGQIPSVVRITNCFTENETAYYSMEFLDGANLRQIVRASKNRLPADEITNIILQVAVAMDIIHKKANILHRDISPENIYITKDKKVKIIDFGSAKQNFGDREKEFSIVLKLKFAPPEQFSPKMKQGTYTDVYSLASTYYFALTGISLPTAMDRLGGVAYVPLKQMNIPVSDRISDAVDRALELNYQDRTQTMQKFIEGLTTRHVPSSPAVSPPPSPAPRPAAPPPPERKARPRRAPYVEVVAGHETGKLWLIPCNTEMRIGRSKADNNIVIIGHPEVSKIHCYLMYEEEQDAFYIRDCSTNGTVVDGSRLKKDQTYKIKAGSKITLASTACIIRIGVKNESG